MKFISSSFFLLALSGLFAGSLIAQDNQQQSQEYTSTQQEQSQTQAETQTKAATYTAPKPKPFPDELSIEEQFSYTIDKSSNFQEYKVIRQTWITKLKANTVDTLISLKANLKTTKDLVQEKITDIETLQSEINTAQEELKKKNSFSLFGIMLSKTGYDSIMWSVIIGLLIAIGFGFVAFRRSYSITLQTKKDLNDVKEEFESFRKKALKSKEEAVRQLFDELSKYKNKK